MHATSGDEFCRKVTRCLSCLTIVQLRQSCSCLLSTVLKKGMFASLPFQRRLRPKVDTALERKREVTNSPSSLVAVCDLRDSYALDRRHKGGERNIVPIP